MKKHEDFRLFLEGHVSSFTGRTLSAKVVSDNISRCRKVEKFFEISLTPKMAAKHGFEESIEKKIWEAGDLFSRSDDTKAQVMYAIRYYIAYAKEISGQR